MLSTILSPFKKAAELFAALALGVKIVIGILFVSVVYVGYHHMTKKSQSSESFEDSVNTRGVSARQFNDSVQRKDPSLRNDGSEFQ